jgi:hypothetical protein
MMERWLLAVPSCKQGSIQVTQTIDLTRFGVRRG